MNQKVTNAKNLYLEGIRDGHYVEAVNKYTGDRYTQHSTGVRDGKEWFIEFFWPFVERNPQRDIQIVRSISDGQYVFLHAYQNINNWEAQWVTTDFFDTDENDKIIEHWDVIAPYNSANPSWRSSVDGETKVTDLDKTDENKQIVKNLLQRALIDGDAEAIKDYIAEDYIQHNKDVGDGRDDFYRLASQDNPPLTYKRIILCVWEWNFVATLSEANWNDWETNQDYAQVDIFRIENGKIVEHWDNVEPVPENDVNGGKF
jgi:predicted SnoaL-like aldol condensation-catalyzing enzyme